MCKEEIEVLRKRLGVLVGTAMMLVASVCTFSGVASAASCPQEQPGCSSAPPVELKTENNVGIKNADYHAYRGLGNQTQKSQGNPSLKVRH
jgi:hypothetical protein